MLTVWWDKISFTGGDGIAFLALLISILSACLTIWFGWSQHRVNQGALDDRKKAAEIEKQAKILVALTGGSGKYAVTFTNAGQHRATQIEIGVTPGSSTEKMLQMVLKQPPVAIGPSETRRFAALIYIGVAPPFVFEIWFNDGRPVRQKAIVTLDLP